MTFSKLVSAVERLAAAAERIADALQRVAAAEAPKGKQKPAKAPKPVVSELDRAAAADVLMRSGHFYVSPDKK